MPAKVTNGLDFAKTSIINAVMNPVASDVAAPVNGEVWYNSTEGRLKYRKNGVTSTIADLNDITGGAITGALWDAQSVIVAVSDNTPVAQVIGEGQVLGRIAGGDVTSLTAAQLRTLLNVENGATADQTAAQIKTAYESNVNTNAFTDALLSKLNGIEAAAEVNDTAAEILAKLLTVDGPGSGLNADTLDGTQLSALATVAYVDSEINGILGGASAAYDTLLEIQNELQSNDADISSILTAQAGKPDKFAANIGNGSATSIAVTHNLGTTDVVVSVKEVATNQMVLADVTVTSANVVTIGFATAPASNAYRAVVIG